jgi:hypothetical protein
MAGLFYVDNSDSMITSTSVLYNLRMLLCDSRFSTCLTKEKVMKLLIYCSAGVLKFLGALPLGGGECLLSV